MKRLIEAAAVIVLAVSATGPAFPANAANGAGGAIPGRMPGTVDASLLYNSGVEALARGDLGPAVAWLLAAHRVDPRARDIRVSLGVARARTAAMQGDGQERADPPTPPAIALSSTESWWLATLLVVLGALLGTIGALRRSQRGWTIAGIVALSLGGALWGACFLGAREEARHPEAVVAALRAKPDQQHQPRELFCVGGAMLDAGQFARLLGKIHTRARSHQRPAVRDKELEQRGHRDDEDERGNHRFEAATRAGASRASSGIFRNVYAQAMGSHRAISGGT